MPTSDLGWPSHYPNVCQIYGVKRKAGYSEEGTAVTESQEVMAKRRCTERVQLVPPVNAHVNIHQPQAQAAHEDLSMDTQTNFSPGYRPPSIDEQIHQVPPSSEPPPQADEHMHSEVDPQFESACHSMDSDYVPDVQQYSQPASVYAYDADVSPRSGRVRCFCKPSWEGIGDLTPYVSDIY